MANETAKDVLVGTNARVFLDGEEIGTWTNLEATITINYEDVIIGSDNDRTPVSYQGDGILNMQSTNSIGVKLFNKIRNNKNARFTIEAELIKDSTGESQVETLNGVTFDSIPLGTWAKGETVKQEMSFRFLPSKTMVSDYIR